MSKRLSAALNHTAACLPARSAAYFWLFCVWFIVLWLLSSGSPSIKQVGEIPYLDKIVHFTYFFIGGALLAMAVGLKWPLLSRKKLFFGVILICAIIGRLDEYHQGFVPGRSGNDTSDWLADIIGGLGGCAFILWCLLPRFPLNQGGKRG